MSNSIKFFFLSGFPHHLAHLHGAAPDWRRAGFPSPFFHHHAHFPPHMLVERPPLNVSPASRPEAQTTQQQLLSPSDISASKFVPVSSSSPCKESPTNSGITTIVTSISDEETRPGLGGAMEKNSSGDENCENDTISVTGSPAARSCSVDIEDDASRKSPPSTGAFTALIQKSSPSWGYKKYSHEFLPHLGPLHQPFNQALAAQLFLQSPIIPASSSQWLYNQLYGGSQPAAADFAWFRHLQHQQGVNLVKKDDESTERKSPSVSSSTTTNKRSPSPSVEGSSRKLRKRSNSTGDSSPKQTDVWRPY